MHMTYLLSGIVIAAVVWAGKTSTSWAEDPADSPEWRVEAGWLVRDGTARRGEGFAANVYISGKGALLTEAACPCIDTHAAPYGGFETLYTTGRGALIDRCIPFPELGQRAWRRSLHYTNSSNETQDVLSAEMRIHPVTGDGDVSWSPPYFRMVNTPSGRSLCFSYWSETEPYSVTGGGVEVASQWRLAPGQEATIGQMSIWVGRPGPAGFPVESGRWFRAHGFSQPLAYPRWLTHGVLYEASAAGHVDSRFSDAGGFDAFGEQVDYLADLGISAIWLNAVHAHKRPPNPTDGAWNHYDPLDFDVVDPILGGPEALGRLARKLDGAGIHFLCETVPHGGHSKQAEGLEAWWTYDRDGKPRNPWGGYGMDSASREWQGVIGGHMAMLAREFGIEGARIDVADGQGPNWGSPRTNHASYSTVGGGIEMLHAIRDGIAQGPAEVPVLIPESPLRREYFGVKNACVVGYGFEFTNFIRDNADSAIHEPARMVELLRGFFEAEKATMPPGAMLIRTLNNHDTVVELGRVQNRFGAGLARALYGVCLAVPGLPMMYQEEETGNFEALRAMNWTRRSIPELGAGQAEYLSPDYFAPGVFAVARGDGRHQTIVLVNLTGKTLRGAVPMPEGAADETVVYDAVALVMERDDVHIAHVRDRTVEWTLEPFETAFLRIGSPPKKHVLAQRFATITRVESSTLDTLECHAGVTGLAVRCGGVDAMVTLPGVVWEPRIGEAGITRLESSAGRMEYREGSEGVTVSCELGAQFAHAPLTLSFSNARRWKVSGLSAVLDDWFVPRHHPFPEGADYVWRRSDVWGHLPHHVYNHVLPAERVWQSLFEPLHDDAPAAALLSGDARGLAVRNLQTDAMNVVLIDGSEAGGPALQFFAVDAALQPQVQQFGIGQPWLVPGLAPAAARPMRVSFTLAPAVAADGDFAAERTALTSERPVFERKGAHFADFFGAVFMPEPATLTWRNLAPVPGSYQVQFELRHSEAGPEGMDLANAYAIEIDGRPVSLEWTQLNTASTGNAYFGHARTEALDLSGSTHTIRVNTKRPWCAVRHGIHLIAAPPQ